MSTQTIRQPYCDLPHARKTPAPFKVSGTWRGKPLRGDVCARHRKQVEAMLGPLMRVRGSGRLTADRQRSAKIRTWAQQQPQWRDRLSANGRLPQDLVEDAIAAGVIARDD